MSAVPRLPARVLYRRGALGELDALACKELGLAEGTELEVHVEDGKLILERAAPGDHRRKVAEALDRAMDEHRDVFAALAK